MYNKIKWHTKQANDNEPPLITAISFAWKNKEKIIHADN